MGPLKRILFLLLISLPIAQLRAQQPSTCPWLSQGSAAHALGGDVSVTVSTANPSEGSCRFSRQQGPPDFLEIRVSKSSLSKCPADATQLKGIGNQAERCRLPGYHSEVVDMISSRIRDLHFTVTLTLHGPKKSQNPQEDPLEQVAEQVAGSLY
jgi:hypothetical protein